MTYAFHHDHLPKTSSTILDRARARRPGLFRGISNWAHRRRQMRELRQLMALDNRMLNDIGVSRHQVHEEYLCLMAGRRS